MTLAAGDTLGPYAIRGLLGSGGMGEVYRAHDDRLRRDVAIKVSNEQFTERPHWRGDALLSPDGAQINGPSYYAVTSDGERFLMRMTAPASTVGEQIYVVLNWPKLVGK